MSRKESDANRFAGCAVWGSVYGLVWLGAALALWRGRAAGEGLLLLATPLAILVGVVGGLAAMRLPGGRALRREWWLKYVVTAAGAALALAGLLGLLRWPAPA